MKKTFVKITMAIAALLVLPAAAFMLYRTSGLPFLQNSHSIGDVTEENGAEAVTQLAAMLENIEPADTSKSLPLSPLLCASKPAANYVINVRDQGAKGDGKTDDTKAIQSAIDLAEGTAGTVLVPAGIYLINADVSLKLHDELTLRMEEGAVLKAIPNDKENFAVLFLNNVKNVTVLGGIIQGERDQHKGTTGEWGMGLRISASKNIVIENVISKDNWGDGFFVDKRSENIRFCGVIGDNNRRKGLTLIFADGVLVKNSTFQRGHGYNSGGIDIEPNEGETVQNYQVIHSRFIFNEDCGLVSTVPHIYTGKAFVRNGVIDGNIAMNNGKVGGYTAGILISQQKQLKVTNNIVKNNVQNGIYLANKSQENLIAGNLLSNNGTAGEKGNGMGIIMEESSNNYIENNVISGSAVYDIYDENGKNKLKGNTATKVFIGPLKPEN